MKIKRHSLWGDLSLTMKVLLQVLLVAVIFFCTNLVMFYQLNRISAQLQQTYSSNVDITELSESLDRLQTSVYQYLMVKSSDSLEEYYKNEAKYRSLLSELNTEIVDNPVMLLEKNIRKTSESYLEMTADTISAKRGRNVERYKECYANSRTMYQFLNSYIYDLNAQQFRDNSETFQSLQKVIRFLATSSTVLIFTIMVLSCIMLYFMVRSSVAPLRNLADTVRLVGQGNFHVKMPTTDSKDEVGILTRTFNSMVASLQEYMDLTRKNLEKEQEMKERELLMENHLKEAQLKYLQSQINPHFLFNSLNAAAQLAMMEDAEKTGVFVEHMADFFRYNVKKGNDDATLEEEVASVENYIYILNVRFSGEIHFTKDVDEKILNCKIPSMILQPIVENSVNHGIRDIEWPGTIHLSIQRRENCAEISVKDNGIGIPRERMQEILNGSIQQDENATDSTGVGMNNVINRLELYYQSSNLVEIISAGENQGTEVLLRLPCMELSEHL